MNLSEIGEFGLIARLQSQLTTRAGVRLGIGDDAAILESLSCPVITMDALIEGVHFRRDWTLPRALGRKAMAVNVSDLAASGARPVAAFVSLALGKNDSVEWVEAIYAGFEDAARQFHFTVAGGDTVKSRGDTMLSIALIGEVIDEKRGPLLRSTARAGDIVMVSGTLGDSAAGLELLLHPESEIPNPIHEALLLRHHEPTPRLELMSALLQWDARSLHAALDISDGIVGDAAHMAKRSGVNIQIDAEKIPISEVCREAAAALEKNPLEWALTGGEDYELFIAVAPERATELLSMQWGEVALTPVGICVESDPTAPPVQVHENGMPHNFKSAWTHF